MKRIRPVTPLKRFYFFLYILSLIGSSCVQDISLQNLRCEYQTDPFGIDTPNPRFSWEISADEREIYQDAYRVMVSDNLIEIQKKKGNCWDSGWIASEIPFRWNMTEKPWTATGNTTGWSVPG